LTSRKERDRDRRYVRRAAERVRDLGELKVVEPAGRHPADGAPLLGPGQVYATWTGRKYHPFWCDAVADKWDNDPHNLLVIEQDTVGGREPCRLCEPQARDFFSGGAGTSGPDRRKRFP
jgi:hypothetical protein